MALKCAIQLGISDAIHKNGNPMTLSELANSLCIHPNKAPSLYRVMRLLVHSNFFIMKKLLNGEEVFGLSINSQLLLKDHPLTQAPLVVNALHSINTEPSHYMSSWLRDEVESPFHASHGRGFWEHCVRVPELNQNFNQAMTCDSQFVTSLLVKNDEFKGLIEGITTLVDVGGGHGAIGKAIAEVFPRVQCIVLDQPHVVEGFTGNGTNLIYVGGDMFKAIPPAQAVLLKWILHDWSDDYCIKILERCNEAIPSKNKGGKVIIIDIVVEDKSENYNIAHYSKTQFLFDVKMMTFDIGSKERTEEEWRKLFIKAGFSDYKIYPILGARSVIEVYLN
ncbi:trans-resveratrol di-O-methyltransferase-like [Chenopodium quinoa]|uniref:Uncharacterized protein n=1 Tax=Chenopodium quinoa TaxID=63459 RepID=A0A803L2N8_CHEQI|nr:trans-resveratrol di-O-methyltransferase-like [Chenopodium quinoa]